MIKFSIGGRTVDPSNMKDALMAAVLEKMHAQINEKIGAIAVLHPGRDAAR